MWEEGGDATEDCSPHHPNTAALVANEPSVMVYHSMRVSIMADSSCRSISFVSQGCTWCLSRVIPHHHPTYPKPNGTWADFTSSSYRDRDRVFRSIEDDAIVYELSRLFQGMKQERWRRLSSTFPIEHSHEVVSYDSFGKSKLWFVWLVSVKI